MNKRLLGIIIIFIGLIALGAIVYFVFFYKFSQPEEAQLPLASQQNEVNVPQTPTPAITETSQINNTQTIKKAEVGQADLKRMAEAFAERFGSYSNQSDYGNVRDLKIFMSSRMQSWADDYINQARAKKIDATIYYGITTKAIANEVRQFDSDLGQAEILVKTQRREATGTTSNASTFYQEIIIKFIRERGVWRVDDVFWQSR